MDHLQFVYDYSSNYFQGHSPRVLLLHSIMGVATNIFPMVNLSPPPGWRLTLTVYLSTPRTNVRQDVFANRLAGRCTLRGARHPVVLTGMPRATL